MALSANSKLLVTGSGSKTAMLWDPAGGKQVRTFPGHSDSVVGVDLAGRLDMGYIPAVLEQPSGKAAVGVSFMHDAPKVLEIDDRIKLLASTVTGTGMFDNVASEKPVGIRCRLDGVVTLSLTQYKEIQATIQKVTELEKRVQSLEKGK